LPAQVSLNNGSLVIYNPESLTRGYHLHTERGCLSIKRLSWLTVLVAVAFMIGRTSVRDTRYPAPEDETAFDAWLQRSTDSEPNTLPAVIRIYDISDVVSRIEEFYKSGPQVTAHTYLFNLPPNRGHLTLADHQDTLAGVIEDTVANESWRENGGTIGWIKFIGGRMVVRQTPEAQAMIAKLLQQLREESPPGPTTRE
jgi:hypothetical protein